MVLYICDTGVVFREECRQSPKFCFAERGRSAFRTSRIQTSRILHHFKNDTTVLGIDNMRPAFTSKQLILVLTTLRCSASLPQVACTMCANTNNRFEQPLVSAVFVSPSSLLLSLITKGTIMHTSLSLYQTSFQTYRSVVVYSCVCIVITTGILATCHAKRLSFVRHHTQRLSHSMCSYNA